MKRLAAAAFAIALLGAGCPFSKPPEPPAKTQPPAAPENVPLPKPVKPNGNGNGNGYSY